MISAWPSLGHDSVESSLHWYLTFASVAAPDEKDIGGRLVFSHAYFAMVTKLSLKAFRNAPAVARKMLRQERF